MEGYTSEQEQVEALRKWWKENGKAVIGGLVLGVAVIGGWRGWQAYAQHRDEQASTLYEQMLAATDPAAAAASGEALTKTYASTPYAALAALTMARSSLEAGDLAAAAGHLRWAVEHTKEPAMQALARVRLARVLLAQGQTDEAAQVLDSAEPGAFAGVYEVVRGDIHAAKGERDQARAAYERALTDLPANDPGRQQLQMKLDELGGQTSPEAVS